MCVCVCVCDQLRGLLFTIKRIGNNYFTHIKILYAIYIVLQYENSAYK